MDNSFSCFVLKLFPASVERFACENSPPATCLPLIFTTSPPIIQLFKATGNSVAAAATGTTFGLICILFLLPLPQDTSINYSTAYIILFCTLLPILRRPHTLPLFLGFRQPIRWQAMVGQLLLASKVTTNLFFWIGNRIIIVIQASHSLYANAKSLNHAY